VEDWRTDGQLFLARAPGLREAMWIGRDGLQHWSAVPGGDVHTSAKQPDPRLVPLLSLAKSRRVLTVSPIFQSSESPTAMYVCLPIGVRKDEYVAGLVDAAKLISAIKARGIPPSHRISVSSAGSIIFSDLGSGSRPGGEVRAAFEVGGRIWTASLAIPSEQFKWFTGQIVAIICVIAALLYAFTILLQLSQKRSAELESTNDQISQLNRTLKEKVADFQTLLDVIPIGIAVSYDPDCREGAANPALARMLGIPRDANVCASGSGGASWQLARNGRELQPDELPMRLAAATGKPVEAAEEQVVRADGATFEVLSYAAPLLDENGRVRGALTALVDISERKTQERLRADLERRLHLHERMKSLGIMAAGIAHDFNNLLTTIIGHASLALEDTTSGPGRERHLTDLLEAAQRAAGLVHQLLSYTGHSHPRLRLTDLSSVVSRWRDGGKISVDVAAGLPPVMADPDEVEQIIQNLVSNAIEASEEPRVEIALDTYRVSNNEPEMISPDRKLDPGVYVRMTVKDSGVGMTSDIAERAFDPFFSTKFLGRGLGLSEVLGIMRSHNGGLRLRTVPNSGTSVELFFPLADKAERAA
jgi:PAS domain S-box-containing protein